MKDKRFCYVLTKKCEFTGKGRLHIYDPTGTEIYATMFIDVITQTNNPDMAIVKLIVNTVASEEEMFSLINEK